MSASIKTITMYKVSAKTYLAFAVVWSLLFWLMTIYSGGMDQFPGSLLFYIAGAGPIVAALTLVHLREDLSVQKEFWISTFDPRRMTLNWMLVALLIHPFVLLLAGVVDLGLGGEIETRPDNPTNTWAWISLIAFVFVFGPLPEEMGWRGVVLDRLQAVMSPLIASILLGVVWSLWHLPLFFIEGTFQSQLVVGSSRFWVFLGTMVPLSIVITWVYNNSRRSILSAVLIHFTGNLVGALVTKTEQMAMLELIILSLVAIVISVRWSNLGFSSD